MSARRAWTAVLAMALAACAADRTTSSSSATTSGATPATGATSATGAPSVIETDVKKPSICIDKIETSRGTSLDTVPIADGSMSDFPREVKSAALGAEAFADPLVAAVTLDGSPVFYKPKKGADANGRPAITVVDAALFGDLACVDVTRPASAPIKVGAATPRAMKDGPRKVAGALVRAGVLRSFVHIEASLCLVEERSDAGGWRGVYRGTHTYFTNEKNVDPVAFEVTIDAGGTISARGL